MRVRGIRARSAIPYRLRLETAIVSAAPDRDGFKLDPYRERSQARRSADLALKALDVRGGVLPVSQGPADTLEVVAFRNEVSSEVEEGRTPCHCSCV